MKTHATLLITLLILPTTLLAQELTGDTIALEPSLMQQILHLILSGLAIALGWLVKNLMPLLNNWLKERLHFRGSAVVADSITQALTHLGSEVQQRIASGQWSLADLEALKKEARGIAQEKLQNLGGFYKKDLQKWIDEQLEVGLGKLLLLVGGKKPEEFKGPY